MEGKDVLYLMQQKLLARDRRQWKNYFLLCTLIPQLAGAHKSDNHTHRRRHTGGYPEGH